eukprot:4772176-Amphidinium_carterae.2
MQRGPAFALRRLHTETPHFYPEGGCGACKDFLWSSCFFWFVERRWTGKQKNTATKGIFWWTMGDKSIGNRHITDPPHGRDQQTPGLKDGTLSAQNIALGCGVHHSLLAPYLQTQSVKWTKSLSVSFSNKSGENNPVTRGPADDPFL